MISGGGSKVNANTRLLYAAGCVVDGSSLGTVVANATIDTTYLNPTHIETSSSKVVSHAYIRFGPISFKGMSRLKARVSASTAGGTTSGKVVRVALFASQGDNAWSGSDGVIIGSSSSSQGDGVSLIESSVDLDKVTLYLNVSDYQTGSYYVYCGTDTNTDPWEAARYIDIHAIAYDPIT
jgi:hypothetical protein